MMSNQDGLSEQPVDPGTSEEYTPIGDDGQGATETAPEPSYLNVDEYQGHMVRVKVDGEEVAVPLSEALGGYSRTADYTRKAQALAEQRREAEFGIALQQALANNPQETLRILQSQYTQPDPQTQEPDWTDDPTEAKFRELESRLARYDEDRASRELREAVGFLQQRYGDDFNAQEVVQRAFATNRMDLENVYKEIAFDRLHQGQQAAAQQRAAEEAARIQSKASNTVHSGNGAANVVAPQATSYSSIEEAWQAAKESLGYTA